MLFSFLNRDVCHCLSGVIVSPIHIQTHNEHTIHISIQECHPTEHSFMESVNINHPHYDLIIAFGSVRTSAITTK